MGARIGKTPRGTGRWLWFTPTILCATVVLSADSLGTGQPGSGFGKARMFLLGLGLLLLLWGTFAFARRALGGIAFRALKGNLTKKSIALIISLLLCGCPVRG